MKQLRAAGRRFAVATVVRTHGSTPQVPGAKLVLADDGTFVGTLGGGCVEADAIDAAKKVMAEGGRSLRSYELTEDLAWNSGLVCGGTMWILAERGDDALTIDGRDVLEDLVQAAEGHGHPLAVTTTYAKTARHTEFVARTIAPVDGAPTARVASVDERHDQVRITGMAEVVRDRSLLESIWNDNPLLRQYLGSLDNPELIIYRIVPKRVRFMREWALDYHEVPVG